MYVAYYIPARDGNWDLACILAGKNQIDEQIETKIRWAIEARLAETVEKYRKIEGSDPDGFPRILTGKFSQQPEEDFVYLKFPSDAWETLAETLSMDMDSGAIEPELREEIKNAFNQIKYVNHKGD